MMKKGLKQGFKILSIVIGTLILLIILTPLLFKEKVKKVVIEAINERINATVEVEDFGLNLFSHFPNATLSLEGVTILGIDSFANDTLLGANTASATIDLRSLFNGNYIISEINLNEVSVLAKVLENGHANYLDIIKNDSTETEETAESNNSSLKLDIQKISVKDCNVVYQNDSTKIKLSLIGWNGELRGNLSAGETTLKTTSTFNEITFAMDSIAYLNKIKGVAKAMIKADLDNMKFTFINSELQLNDLAAVIEGSITMSEKDDEGIDFNLKLNTVDTNFKDILSVIPTIYTDDFKNIKTSGTATIDAYVKGMMQNETFPAFDIKILVKDAMFQYPTLPKKLDKINVNIAVTNQKQGYLDNMVIDINKFSFNLGGNPFTGSLKVTKPMSDPNFALYAYGTLDLGMIKDVYPLEDGTELNGKFTANLQLATAMSYIEKEQYEKVTAHGNLTISDMILKSKSSKDIQVKNAELEFTPKYANLKSLNAKIGNNDMMANGRLENFLGYAIKGKTLKGQLSISSDYLNINDFMGEQVAYKNDTTKAVSSSQTFIIPQNIDFTMNANLKHLLYEKINITNFIGSIAVKNGILELNNVSANLFSGSAKINGKYDTSNGKTANTNFAINLNSVSFAETFSSVITIQKLAPIFEDIVGTYSMNLNFNTTMGTIDQILQNLSANGNLQTNNINLGNIEVLNKLSSALKNESLKNISPKNLNIPFSVNNGKITTKPFSFNFSDGGIMKLEGSTNLSQEINYKGSITLPKSLSNNFVKNIGLAIGGSFKQPKISIDTKSLAEDAINSLAGKLIGTSGTNAVVDKQKQAQTIRDEAKKTSDKLVSTAQEQADKLIKGAGNNKLAQIGAKTAGTKLVNEAKKQGQRLIDEAEKKAKEMEEDKLENETK